VYCTGLEEEDTVGHQTLTSPSGRVTSSFIRVIGSVISPLFFFFLFSFIKFLNYNPFKVFVSI
jgi:hypothetical protein